MSEVPLYRDIPFRITARQVQVGQAFLPRSSRERTTSGYDRLLLLTLKTDEFIPHEPGPPLDGSSPYSYLPPALLARAHHFRLRASLNKKT